MKTVSARQANHDFSELLSRVERGEEARGVIVPLSPAAADTGTASGHRSCNRKVYRGARPYELSGAMKCTTNAGETNILGNAILSVPPREDTWGARPARTGNADGIMHFTAANARGVQQRGGSQGRNRGR
jgi:hypothetical protein